MSLSSSTGSSRCSVDETDSFSDQFQCGEENISVVHDLYNYYNTYRTYTSYNSNNFVLYDIPEEIGEIVEDSSWFDEESDSNFIEILKI